MAPLTADSRTFGCATRQLDQVDGPGLQPPSPLPRSCGPWRGGGGILRRAGPTVDRRSGRAGLRRALGLILPQEIIRAKRDGQALSEEEIGFIVRGLTDGDLADSQVAAWAMAVFFRGTTTSETVALVASMRDSGTVLEWSACGLAGPPLDKHSTGGVGDKVSLMLVPIVAACGAAVPMISSRGLGHTGGTLDKMDSIPGYTTTPSLEVFRGALQDAGCAIIGPTNDDRDPRSRAPHGGGARLDLRRAVAEKPRNGGRDLLDLETHARRHGTLDIHADRSC